MPASVLDNMEVTLVRDVIEEIGYKELVSKPTEILGDNKAATIWANDSRITVKNRFIHRHFFAVRDTLNEGSVSVKWVDTKNNPADVFTKNISREVVEHLMPILSGRAELPEAPAVAPLVTRQAEPTAA